MPGGRKKKDSKFWKDQLKKGATQFRIGSVWDDPSPAGSETAGKDASQDEQARRLEEQQKYGIDFDDGYNYLQHLKSVSELYNSEMIEMPRVQKEEDEDSMAESGASGLPLHLPGSGLELVVEGDGQGLEMDVDPDIIAALEGELELGPDDELEDDFVSIANMEPAPSCDRDVEQLAHNVQKMVHFEGEDMVEVGDSDDDWTDDDEADWTDEEEEEDEEKGIEKQTGDRIPSSRSVLDAHVKVLKQREYSEDQIGGLDYEELSGRVTYGSDLCQQAVQEFESSQNVVTLKDIVDSPDRIRPYIPESWKYVEEKDGDDEGENERREKISRPVWSPKKTQWDCVSILSTLSRTKNLPQTMDWPSPETERKKKKKKHQAEGEPVNEHSNVTRGLTLKELEQQMKTERLADAPSTYRPSGETAEERRERKKAAKQHQRERRAEKKANKLAFQNELQRQKKLVRVREIQEKVVSFQDNK